MRSEISKESARSIFAFSYLTELILTPTRKSKLHLSAAHSASRKRLPSVVHPSPVAAYAEMEGGATIFEWCGYDNFSHSGFSA